MAEACEIREDPGQKGKSGVLRSQATRKAFPSDAKHRSRFAHTPKHCSWPNQIEIWFGILSRELPRRSSFESPEALREEVLRFIDYFNETMAKLMQWLYSPKPRHEEVDTD